MKETMMKRIRLWSLVFFLSALPAVAHASIGLGVGAVDKDHFGYGISFGGSLPSDFGVDCQILGYAKTGTIDNYWIQGNADLTYDFNFLWKKLTEVIELHPYVKGGFTYGALITNTANVSVQSSRGPGFNFGGGVDWKLLPFLTIGTDLTANIIYMTGSTIVGYTTTRSQTTKAFNAFAFLKFFAY